VERAFRSVGFLGAAIWHLKPNSEMTLRAATDSPFLSRIQAILAAHPDGPSWHALHTGTIAFAADLTRETRWASYVAEVLTCAPVRSVVSCRAATNSPRNRLST
jgi:hypothetical protein